jgi:hypothetical protein
MADPEWLLQPIREIHGEIRDLVVSRCEQSRLEEMSEVVEEGGGDTLFAIDRISEARLVALFDERIASRAPMVLIGEGIAKGKITLPLGTPAEDAVWRVIVDPIDGTRSLMYQKRSGWILTGVAPNRGDDTSLADIELAVQTEIPLVKQHLSDCLWAQKGSGARGERFNRITKERTPFTPAPSAARELDHGFATIVRFFSGGREVLGAVDDELACAVLGCGGEAKAPSFEDQYLSTGGELYELMMGHDRLVADLRPLLVPILEERRASPGLSCHPYDISTELIAREAGVIITGGLGDQLNAALNIEADVSWVGYANRAIRELVEPRLHDAIEKHLRRPKPVEKRDSLRRIRQIVE